MKVRELIDRLKQLDQDKEIKFTEVHGYDWTDAVSNSVYIELYKDTEDTYIRKDGTIDKYHRVEKDYDVEDDFYLLAGFEIKGEVCDQRK